MHRHLLAVTTIAILALGTAACDKETAAGDVSESDKNEFVGGVIEDEATSGFDLTAVSDREMIRLGLITCRIDDSNADELGHQVVDALAGKVRYLDGGTATPVDEETVGLIIQQYANAYLC